MAQWQKRSTHHSRLFLHSYEQQGIRNFVPGQRHMQTSPGAHACGGRHICECTKRTPRNTANVVLPV